MTNLWMGLIALFIFGFILSAIVQGQHGLATTQLAASLTEEAGGPVTVTTTAGFPDSGIIILNDEHMRYSGRSATQFGTNSLTRGFNDTQPRQHPVGLRVYNESTGFMNRLIGYRVLESVGHDNFFVGMIRTVVSLPGILKQIVVSMISWNFSFLENPVGVYIKYVLGFVLSAGVIMALIRLFASRGG